MADLTRVVGAPNSNLLMTIWATLIFAAVAFIGPLTGLTDAPRLPTTTAGLLFIAAVGITFSLGYLCFFLSAHIIGVARTSLLSTSEPIMIILFAVLLVGQTVTPIQWLGILLVIGSLAAVDLSAADTPASFQNLLGQEQLRLIIYNGT